MSVGIYRISNTKTGKAYIGSSIRVESRIRTHQKCLLRGDHPNNKLQRSWHTHGSQVWTFELVEVCHKEDLIVREQHWIDLLDSCSNGYNIAPYADHREHAPETRRKIGEANRKRGKDLTSAIGRKVGEANRMRSPELKAEIGKKSRGRIHSPETKAKISSSGKGKKRSPETRERMRLAALIREEGRRQDPEKRAEVSRKISEGLKRSQV